MCSLVLLYILRFQEVGTLTSYRCLIWVACVWFSSSALCWHVMFSALQSGVPQGSVLWPILFIICTSQRGQTIERYQVARQHFVDDNQLESSCDTDEYSVKATVKNLEHCCTDIKTWVLENRLELSGDKTEVLPCSLKKAAQVEHAQVGESQINLSASVRDLGLVIDADLDMTAHISSVIKSCYCHLRSFGKSGPFWLKMQLMPLRCLSSCPGWTIVMALCGALKLMS